MPKNIELTMVGVTDLECWVIGESMGTVNITQGRCALELKKLSVGCLYDRLDSGTIRWVERVKSTPKESVAYRDTRYSYWKENL